MLKYALTFAGAGLLTILAAPALLPMLESSPSAPGARVSATAPTDGAQTQQAYAATTAPQGFRELQLSADSHGQYTEQGYIDGQAVDFLVDTGASMVVISSELASRLGLVETANSPHYRMQTANGQTTNYGVTLKNIDLGSIYIADIPAVVSSDTGGTNLLGANFLKRLGSVEQRGDRLILRQ